MTDNFGSSAPRDPRNAKADAKAAKAYAKASRPWYQKKRWWAAGAVIVIGGASAVSGGAEEAKDDSSTVATDSNESNSTETESNNKKSDTAAKKPAKAAPKPAEPEALVVQAGAIVKEFEDNELAADAKYKDKTLKITGVVDKIDTEFLNDEKYVLRLGEGGDWVVFTVDCYDMSTEDLAKYNKGDTVTVIGEFDDGGDLGVEVKDCRPA